jgi:hypothetical protein
MRILRIDDGGDGKVVTVSTLPSLHTVGPTYASYRMIENSFLDVAVSEEDISDESDVTIGSVNWVASLPDSLGSLGKGLVSADVPQAKLLDAFVSGTGYFGNEAGEGTIYAQCAVLVHMPRYDTEERNTATSLAYAAAFGTPLPTEAFVNTRAGVTVETEEQVARERYEEYSRSHPSHGLKKPKMQSKGRKHRGNQKCTIA